MVPRRCSLGRGMPYHHQTMLVRKSIFNELGLFDDSFRYGMDFEHVCRMKKANKRSFYFNDYAAVVMDGGGVSVGQELGSIKECYRALKKNQLLGLSNYFGLGRRLAMYFVRKVFLLLRLDFLLKKLKIIKNRFHARRSFQ